MDIILHSDIVIHINKETLIFKIYLLKIISIKYVVEKGVLIQEQYMMDIIQLSIVQNNANKFAKLKDYYIKIKMQSIEKPQDINQEVKVL